MEKMKSFWTLVLLASLGKLLMLKAYRSTDFEVHRNWLAITHSLPMEKWYYEATSEWTLDYPPFFAYFEWTLSHGAGLFDENMLNVTNLNYASERTILFQKLTVVLTDLVLAYGIVECAQAMPYVMPKAKRKPENYALELFGLIFINGGLFLVDHIHFQYNGFLFGVLLLSLGKICKGQCYQGAFLFASLLCLKHIFLYIAPAIGIYLLRTCCVKADRRGVPISINFRAIAGLAGIVATVGSCAFGPFYKHIPQILGRLFPFQRGLSHAYWAPNVWAAYNSLDLILGSVLRLGKSGTTSGLVGEISFAVLPQIRPIHTFLITLLVILPILWRLWKTPSPASFIYAVTLTAWTSFMFGYHVHEKAILNVLIPFGLIAFLDSTIFFLTLSAGTVSLFPLLFTPFEIILKGIIFLFNLAVVSKILKLELRWYHAAYLLGLIPVSLFENLGVLVIPKLPFLPLVLVSDYTLLGIGSCYVALYSKYVLNLGKQLTSTQRPPAQNQLTPTSPVGSPRILRKRK